MLQLANFKLSNIVELYRLRFFKEYLKRNYKSRLIIKHMRYIFLEGWFVPGIEKELPHFIKYFFLQILFYSSQRILLHLLSLMLVLRCYTTVAIRNQGWGSVRSR